MARPSAGAGRRSLRLCRCTRTALVDLVTSRREVYVRDCVELEAAITNDHVAAIGQFLEQNGLQRSKSIWWGFTARRYSTGPSSA